MRIRRILRQFAQGTFVGVLGLFLLAASPSASLGAEKILFLADWVIYGIHAPFASAIHEGFFKEEGLEVSFHRGYGSGETVKTVGLGKADFGVASMGPLIISRVRGNPVRQIAMQGHKFVQGIFYLKGSGISKPKDFEGKRMGGPMGSADRLMLPIFCKATGINCSAIQWISMESSAKVPSLVTGRVEAMPDFSALAPQYESAANAAGKDVAFLAYADWGVDIYSNGNVASEKTIKGRPRTVQKFVNAVMRGWAWAYRNPDAAVGDLLKQRPELSRGINRRSLEVTLAHLFDGLSEKQGIGVMDREKVKRTIEVTLTASNIQAALNPDDVFTNDFASRVPEQWRFPKGKP